ncbi:hypothetical protein scyTo_0024649, partial [Scyliorhinus torazame]|nr:hypothetical protein [Scyliorhinus torazame]
VHELRQNVSKDHETIKKKELEQGAKASYGYGGKFGVQKDRMDKVIDHSKFPFMPLDMKAQTVTLYIEPFARSTGKGEAGC